MNRWKNQGAVYLFLLFGLFSTEASCIDCWGSIVVDDSSVFKIAGTNYSNCVLKIRFDSEAVWLHKISLGSTASGPKTISKYDFWDPSETPFYQSLVGRGMVPFEAHTETYKARNKVWKRAFERFKSVRSPQKFEMELSSFHSDGLAKDLGIQLDWNEKLNQPLILMEPSGKWTTIRPDLLIVDKASCSQPESISMCDVYDEINEFLNTENKSQFRAVIVSDGQVEFLEKSNWNELNDALDRF